MSGISLWLWRSHSQIRTHKLGMEQPYVLQSNTIHHCTLVAGGLNEYIWQAWAYLEGKQNNIGQARKVRFSTPYFYAHAVCCHDHGVISKRRCIKVMLPHYGHDISVQVDYGQNFIAVLQRLA